MFSSAVAALLALASLLAEPLTFRWPVPAKVTVTEKVFKKGSGATLRYHVSLTRAPDGKRLTLRITNFDFVEVGGRDPHDAAFRKQLAGALQAASALPTLLISPDGE